MGSVGEQMLCNDFRSKQREERKGYQCQAAEDGCEFGKGNRARKEKIQGGEVNTWPYFVLLFIPVATKSISSCSDLAVCTRGHMTVSVERWGMHSE